MNHIKNRIQKTCSSAFQLLSHYLSATIIGLVCRLLEGEVRGTLLDYCIQLCHKVSRCQSSHHTEILK